MSGGQQQRVALARALVAQPQVLLLDEPLSNLDAKLREQMRFELKSLQESFGITTVYVTHDQEEALALSDRIGLMHEGLLLEVGSPSDLYLRPAHRITADFLGTANFIAGQVARPGIAAWDEMLLDTPDRQIRRPAQCRMAAGHGGGAVFPSGKYRAGGWKQSWTARRITVPALVERVTFLGNSVDVILRSGEVRLRLRAHPARIPGVGTRVSFSVAAESCIVFPA